MLYSSFTRARRFFSPFYLLPILILLLAGCGQNADASQPLTSTGGVGATNCDIQVSWALGYRSLKELKQARELDLAVQGTFTALQSTQGQFSSGDLSTEFSFVPNKVLLDPQQLSQAEITIHQTGGRSNNTLHQVCGDPLFQIGEEAILFLRQFSPGQYLVIGGPSGRFAVRKGFVQPNNDEGVKLPANLTEQQFYTMLQQV